MSKYSLIEQELKIRSKTIHSEKGNISDYNPQDNNEDKKLSNSIFQMYLCVKLDQKHVK